MKAPEFGIAQADLDHCAELLRSTNRNTWLATLLMSDVARTASTVLWALSEEIASISSRVNEPLAGEVRLRWWSDVLDGGRDGEAQSAPLARAVLKLKATAALPTQPLLDMVEAHVADLYGDSIADRTNFEIYAGETQSAVFQLACVAVLEDDAAECATSSGHAGVVHCSRNVLREAMGVAPSKRQKIPGDLLAACGTSAEEFAVFSKTDRARVLQGFAEYGEEHLIAYREACKTVPAAARPVYLPLAGAAEQFTDVKRSPESWSRPTSLWKQQWRLWRASKRGIV